MSAKRIVVTGASRGIGRELALLLTSAGWSVAAVARESDELRSVERECRQIAASTLAVAADIRTERGVIKVRGAVRDAWGGIDVLVNNAGVFTEANLRDISATELDDAWATNAKAPILMTQAVVDDLMESRGHVINIGSRSAVKGVAREIAFCTSKYAVAGFSSALREELRGTGVRVSCIHPGPVNTWGAEGDEADGLLSPKTVAELIEFVARGRAEYYDTRLGMPE